ncbi:hypothetical protein [Roseovarius aestuariivivens]|uniref:hypothetical protein n=1 Tax=Roseovarius aestuariivivens TaxID=1888910 RepID=UPI001081FBA0|nr:hypothetical protein [Roseovarius aestuariivivens]
MTSDLPQAPPQFFGSEAQQRMQAIAHDLWPLLNSSPAYGYEGRMVGIDGATVADQEAVAALARIQGATVCHYTPLVQETALGRAFAQGGLVTDRWDQFMGGADCWQRCAAFVAGFHMPRGYTLNRVGADTPARTLAALAETALGCGVLPPALPVLSGQRLNAVCYFLQAPDGGVAACAGAVMRNHPDSPFARASWWGMLATRQQDRGHALSLYLGARAALHMQEVFGATSVYTGVRHDNAASRHVCKKLGVTESDYACLAILDPGFFGAGGYTK